jgi:steroid 5-alpha reductase family enzyme
VRFGLCAALAGAWFTTWFLNGSADLLWITFIADTIATIIIFIFSIAFKNASFYDPYWSVAPIAIVWYWNAQGSHQCSLMNLLFMVAFIVWGIRLTLNWARGWKGLHHEDWRYTSAKKQTGTCTRW